MMDSNHPRADLERLGLELVEATARHLFDEQGKGRGASAAIVLHEALDMLDTIREPKAPPSELDCYFHFEPSSQGTDSKAREALAAMHAAYQQCLSHLGGLTYQTFKNEFDTRQAGKLAAQVLMCDE